jgi:hypothetical protein
VGVVIATALGLAIVPGLVLAITFLLDRWLIGRGRGHPMVHGGH